MGSSRAPDCRTRATAARHPWRADSRVWLLCRTRRTYVVRSSTGPRSARSSSARARGSVNAARSTSARIASYESFPVAAHPASRIRGALHHTPLHRASTLMTPSSARASAHRARTRDTIARVAGGERAARRTVRGRDLPWVSPPRSRQEDHLLRALSRGGSWGCAPPRQGERCAGAQCDGRHVREHRGGNDGHEPGRWHRRRSRRGPLRQRGEAHDLAAVGVPSACFALGARVPYVARGGRRARVGRHEPHRLAVEVAAVRVREAADERERSQQTGESDRESPRQPCPDSRVPPHGSHREAFVRLPRGRETARRRGPRGGRLIVTSIARLSRVCPSGRRPAFGRTSVGCALRAVGRPSAGPQSGVPFGPSAGLRPDLSRVCPSGRRPAFGRTSVILRERLQGELGFAREVRIGEPAQQGAPRVLGVVVGLDLGLAPGELLERVVEHLLVRRLLAQRREDRDRLLLLVQLAVRARELQLRLGRHLRRVVVLERLLERRRRLLPALQPPALEPLQVQRRRLLDARLVHRVREELRLALGQRLLLHRLPSLDEIDAPPLLREVEELRRLELGRVALGLALPRLVEVLLHARVLVAQVLAGRVDGVDARVDRELERREDHDHEHDVRRGAVPGEAPLVALLALGDRFDVGRQGVREVVRLDDEPSRLDDLALDVAQLVVDFVHRARWLTPGPRPPASESRPGAIRGPCAWHTRGPRVLPVRAVVHGAHADLARCGMPSIAGALPRAASTLHVRNACPRASSFPSLTSRSCSPRRAARRRRRPPASSSQRVTRRTTSPPCLSGSRAPSGGPSCRARPSRPPRCPASTSTSTPPSASSTSPRRRPESPSTTTSWSTTTSPASRRPSPTGTASTRRTSSSTPASRAARRPTACATRACPRPGARRPTARSPRPPATKPAPAAPSPSPPASTTAASPGTASTGTAPRTPTTPRAPPSPRATTPSPSPRRRAPSVRPRTSAPPRASSSA